MTTDAPDPDERMMRTATAELVAAEQHEPVPESLLNSVMRGVWADLRRSRMLPLLTVSGPAFVAQHVVTTVISRALRPLTAMQLRSSTLHTDSASSAKTDDIGSYADVTVRISVSTRYGTDLVQLTGRARDVVRRTIGEQFGWKVSTVEIDLVDVFVPGGDDEHP